MQDNQAIEQNAGARPVGLLGLLFSLLAIALGMALWFGVFVSLVFAGALLFDGMAGVNDLIINFDRFDPFRLGSDGGAQRALFGAGALIYLSALASLLTVARLFGGKHWADLLGWRGSWPKINRAGWLLIACAPLYHIGAGAILRYFFPDFALWLIPPRDVVALALSFLMIVILAPLAEELLFSRLDFRLVARAIFSGRRHSCRDVPVRHRPLGPDGALSRGGACAGLRPFGPARALGLSEAGGARARHLQPDRLAPAGAGGLVLDKMSRGGACCALARPAALGPLDDIDLSRSGADFRGRLRRPARRTGANALAALTGGTRRWLTPFPKAPADTFVRQGVRSGSLVTRAECEAANDKDRARFVYVEALGRGACIRYHLSAETFPGKVAAVYLPGDKGGFRISWRNGQYEMYPEELIPREGQPAADAKAKAPDMSRKLGEADRNQSFARALGGRLQTPTILIARQGTDGSSGWVALRRTRWEVEITNRALDAIKARHGIEKLHLVGQSGGGHLVGSLSALRTDIACAVAGSAPLAFDPKSLYLSDKVPAPQRFFNPVDHAETIAKKPGLRLMLVTDGGDTRVFVDRQAAFVRALARHGVKTPQFFVTAGDALSHGVTTYSVAAFACASKASRLTKSPLNSPR